VKDDEPFYRPFSRLREFLEENNIAARESSGIIPDESLGPGTCDFSEEMKDVARISPRTNRIGKKPPLHGPAPGKRDGAAEFEVTLQDYRRYSVTNLPEYMEGFVEGINPLVLEKLRSGEFSVQGIIDLHGCSIDGAENLFSGFLKESILAGLHCIKVIHGRGLRSRGEPVLKESLKAWIVKAMNRKWVVAFASAHMGDGGPGATYVLLRKRAIKKKIHIIG
jgi:DNA-nicking Smr family endonuclease